MGLEGDLASLSVGEVLQTLQLGGKSGALLLSRTREQILVCLRQGLLEAILAVRGDRFSIAWTLYIEGHVDRQGREEWLDAFSSEEERISQLMESQEHTRTRTLLLKHTLRLLVEIESWTSGEFVFNEKGSTPTQPIFLNPPLNIQGQWLEAVRRRDEIDGVSSECQSKSVVFRRAHEQEEIGSEISAKAQHLLEGLGGTTPLELAFDVFHGSRYEALEALRELVQARALLPFSRGKPVILERAFWKGIIEEDTTEVEFGWKEPPDSESTEPELEFSLEEDAETEAEPMPAQSPPHKKPQPPRTRSESAAPPPPPPEKSTAPRKPSSPRARSGATNPGIIADAELRRKVRLLTEGLEEIVPQLPTAERWKRRLLFLAFVLTLCGIGVAVLVLNLGGGQAFFDLLERWWSNR